MKRMFAILTVLSITAGAQAALRTRTVEYKQGGVPLEGYLAYDDSLAGKRPGVLVVHEWWGLDDYAKRRARQLAEMGYAAFALDMYGKGVRAKTPEEAGRLSGKIKGDRALMRSRAQAGLEALKRQEVTDPGRVAAVGYCFGGTTVLELARGGADVAGVVSFHGNLDTPSPAGPRSIKGKVLVLQGGDDPYAPAAQVPEFGEEMRRAGADWQVIVYGGAVHGFTNPANGNDNGKGAAYNEKADRRSWQAMKDFFAEIFK